MAATSSTGWRSRRSPSRRSSASSSAISAASARRSTSRARSRTSRSRMRCRRRASSAGELERSPTPARTRRAHQRATVEQVMEALARTTAHRADSLDRPLSEDGDTAIDGARRSMSTLAMRTPRTPTVVAVAARHLAGARAADPAAALPRGPHPSGDRRAPRHLADACLALDPQVHHAPSGRGALSAPSGSGREKIRVPSSTRARSLLGTLGSSTRLRGAPPVRQLHGPRGRRLVHDLPHRARG